MEVDFYRLGDAAVETVLPLIAAKCLRAGERLLVVAADEAMRARIAQALWSDHRHPFLANGIADGDTAARDDPRQPILIAATPAPANGARHIAFADGIWRDVAEGEAFTRAFLFVAPDQIDEARAAWKALGLRPGVTCRSWTREGGRWERLR